MTKRLNCNKVNSFFWEMLNILITLLTFDYCQALVPSPVLLDPKPNPNQSKIKIQVQLGLGWHYNHIYKMKYFPLCDVAWSWSYIYVWLNDHEK